MSDPSQLSRLARSAFEGAPITFIPDRAGQPIALGAGIDRDHSDILGAVGLDLAKLPQNRAKPETIVAFLLAYVRARQVALREWGPIDRGFRLNRARLLVSLLHSDPSALLRAIRSQPALALSDPFGPPDRALPATDSPLTGGCEVSRDPSGTRLSLEFRDPPDATGVVAALAWARRSTEANEVQICRRVIAARKLAPDW